MGIPAFYRWFADRFPRSVVNAADADRPRIDNLYLDMNGIIHPCFHPEDMEPPKNYDEVFKAIFSYIDTLLYVVQPHKLLYLAIDGVAPRAKMNQQRSRRFMAAKEEEEKAGGIVKKDSQMDSNVITPGTEFMALLSSALSYYIQLRMKDDPGWQGIKVILSDANVPGEGEHKIMSYIRLQRNLPGYDPNTRHCLYGLDADLIMLALTTHEIHFSILRESVQKESALSHKRPFQPCPPTKESAMQKYQFLHIWILREYLAYTMKIPDKTISGDLDRLIDDFVFMCFFVGNDFLPSLPTLKIKEGAIDLLLAIYQKEFVRMGGYMTNSCEVNLHRVKHFLQALADYEACILRKREQLEISFSKEKQTSLYQKNVGKTPVGEDSVKSTPVNIIAPNNTADFSTNTEVNKNGDINLRDKYYANKFNVETKEGRERIRSDLVLKYIEGVCWVMHYYHAGVCSWQWFYPYHYAPFASDFHDIEKLNVQFTLGEPFKPFDQLMAVLPAASGHALPYSYRKLMTDPSSPLLPFYPTDFELDMEGKRFLWQAIIKLPFIDETLLLSEIAKVQHTLTDEERQRNSLGLDKLFVFISHPLATEIVSFYKKNIGVQKLAMSKIEQPINPDLSGGMNGLIIISDQDVHPVDIDSPVNGLEKIENNQAVSVFYKFPPFHHHIPRPVEGVLFPRKCIRKKHIQATPILWHERSPVVGWLHFCRPVPGSISGRRLGKSACRLVKAWYLEKQQQIMTPLTHGEGITSNIGNGAAQIPIEEHRGSNLVREPQISADRQVSGSVGKQFNGNNPSEIQLAANGPVSTLLPSGNCTAKKLKQKLNRKARNVSEHIDAKAVLNNPELVSTIQTATPGSNSVVGIEKQSSDIKPREIEDGPASTPKPGGNSTAKKLKQKAKNGSEHIDVQSVVNGPELVSTIKAATSGGVALNVSDGIDKQSSDIKPREIEDRPASTLKPGGNSTAKKLKRKAKNGSEHIDVQSGVNGPELVSTIKAATSGGVALNVSDGIEKQSSDIKPREIEDGPASTPKPGENSTAKKLKRKAKNGSEHIDVQSVVNGPELVSTIKAATSGGVALNVSDGIKKQSSDIKPREIEDGPASTPKPGGNSTAKKLKRKAKNGSEHIDVQSGVNGPELVSTIKAATSGGVALNVSDGIEKQSSDIKPREVEDGPASTPKPGKNSTAKKLKRKAKNGSEHIDVQSVVNGPELVSTIKAATSGGVALNVSDGIEKQSSDNKSYEVQIAANGSDSTPLPSGNSTAKKLKRKSNNVSEHIDAQVVVDEPELESTNKAATLENGIVIAPPSSDDMGDNHQAVAHISGKEPREYSTAGKESTSSPLPSGNNMPKKVKRKSKKVSQLHTELKTEVEGGVQITAANGPSRSPLKLGDPGMMDNNSADVGYVRRVKKKKRRDDKVDSITEKSVESESKTRVEDKDEVSAITSPNKIKTQVESKHIVTVESELKTEVEGGVKITAANGLGKAPAKLSDPSLVDNNGVDVGTEKRANKKKRRREDKVVGGEFELKEEKTINAPKEIQKENVSIVGEPESKTEVESDVKITAVKVKENKNGAAEEECESKAEVEDKGDDGEETAKLSKDKIVKKKKKKRKEAEEEKGVPIQTPAVLV